MADSASLLIWAIVTTPVAAAVIRRQHSLQRFPRVGIAVWMSALFSTLLSIVLAATTLALHTFSARDAIADAIRACATNVHEQYAQLPSSAIVGILALVAAFLWVLFHALRQSLLVRSVRRRHRQLIDLVGVDIVSQRITVLDHPSSNVYCLPGKGGRVVATSSAVDRLTAEQLAAVVAHERAHLKGRHHALVGTVKCLATALPFSLFRQARDSVTFLIERVADEQACRVSARRTLASAMLVLGSARTPEGAMGAAGPSVARRASLLSDSGHPAYLQAVAVVLFTTVLVAVPLGLALGPVVGWNWPSHCVVLRSVTT